MTYPNAPGFKERTTSKTAAAAVSSRSSALRYQVLDLLEMFDMTADEVADWLGVSVLAVRPRVSELHTRKLIVKTGERRTNNSGLKAHVWIAA